MAMLEVHDGEGRVRRVTISRDQTVLFGTSPKCDIVLEGPGVLPFHGRLRWKSTRYKVDASPDARYLEVNGQRLAAASFRQGDEITVGPCRIFLIHADEELPQDDKTRVQPMPQPRGAAVAPPPPTRSTRRPQTFEQTNWFQDLEVAPSSAEVSVDEPEVLTRKGRHRGEARPKDKDKGKAKERGGLRGLLRVFSAGQAPGEERILTSPLVFGLAITLAILVVLGVALNTIIARTVAARLYQRALESLEDGDYRNAIRRFDEYLAHGPRNPMSASRARVLRALANVRQFTTTTGASWSNALAAEREMVDRVGREPAYRDSSIELAELVARTAEGLAERAKATSDARALAEAESAAALHAAVAGPAAETMLVRTKLPAKLADARAAVHKAETRRRALEAMDAAIRDRSATAAYAARDDLVRRYADLAGDREIVARMAGANDLIRRAVTFDSTHRAAESTPRTERLGPPTSLVLRSSTPAAPGPGRRAPPVFALADGLAYGLDGASGEPLWQVPVGLGSPFPPLAVPGGSGVLAFDARHDELVRLDARTGAIAWRLAIGERIEDPPLVLGNQVIQPTPGGSLLLIDLPTGELRGTVRLGMPLSRTPVTDEAGQHLYVLAAQDCLFVLTRDPIECVAVEYLGHASGSIPCAPARLARFLIVAENHALTEGRWRVFVLEEDGAKVRPVQQVATPGWTWDTPASAGSIVWATGDRGGTTAYAVGGYDEASPFRLLARTTPDAEPSGPAFALARSEREIWVSGGRPGRYDLELEKGALLTAWSLAGVGPALAPIQLAGPLVVLTHQPVGQPGASVWGLDSQTGAVRWQTVLGAPWPAAPSPSPDADALTALAPDGSPVVLPRDRLADGGFVTSPIPGPGDFRLPPGPIARLEADGITVVVPGGKARHLFVRRDGVAYKRIELPVAVGATPLAWGRDVLLPGDDGRAYLIDPATGESRAEPFVPAFDRDHPARWRAPVRIDGEAVALAEDAGKVRRLTLERDPRPRLVASAEAALGSALVADPASTGSAIVVATADGRVRSLSARDLSPVGAWPLDAPPAPGPLAAGGLVFVADRAGGVLALGTDGQRLWSTALGEAPAVGAPVVADDSAWFLARDGTLHRRSLKDGSPIGRIDLGVLPGGDPLRVGPDLVIATGHGTLRLLNPKDPGPPAANP